MTKSPSDQAAPVPPRSEQPVAQHAEASEEHLRALLGLTSSILFEFDAEGRYLSVATPSEELLAAPREQLLGRTIPEVIEPQTAALFLEHIQGVLASGKAGHFEYALEVLGGRRWFRADVTVLPQRQSALFVVQDITQQKGLEQHLVQSDRLAALGTLAAGVAHEVNNPLSYVSSNLHFALEGLTELLQAMRQTGAAPEPSWLERTVRECTDALAEAQEGTTRIRRIVGDLKTFARGKDVSEESADVRRALEAALNLVSPEVRFRAHLSKQLAEVPMIRGSEARLGQVFLNLLINAVQAIPEGAPEKNRVEARLRVEGDRVVVEIQDTGSGIPPELRERIFDPFFSTKPAGVGTGLGLSICHGIITGMGGDISVESTVGQGSCFRVRLPLGA